MPDSSVEEERRLALDRLRQMQMFYERPEAAQLLQQMQGRASGTDSPYTQGVVNSQLADNADGAAGQVRSEREGIARAFGNAGLSGSGLQMSANINSRRRASALARQGRNQITSRATLANFQARENAQQQVQSYLGQINASKMQAGQAEVDFRGQAREVTQEPVGAQQQQPAGGGFSPTNPNLAYGGAGAVAVQGPTPMGGWQGGGQLGLNAYQAQNQSTFNTMNPAQSAMMRAFGSI